MQPVKTHAVDNNVPALGAPATMRNTPVAVFQNIFSMLELRELNASWRTCKSFHRIILNLPPILKRDYFSYHLRLQIAALADEALRDQRTAERFKELLCGRPEQWVTANTEISDFSLPLDQGAIQVMPGRNRDLGWRPLKNGGYYSWISYHICVFDPNDVLIFHDKCYGIRLSSMCVLPNDRYGALSSDDQGEYWVHVWDNTGKPEKPVQVPRLENGLNAGCKHMAGLSKGGIVLSCIDTYQMYSNGRFQIIESMPRGQADIFVVLSDDTAVESREGKVFVRDPQGQVVATHEAPLREENFNVYPNVTHISVVASGAAVAYNDGTLALVSGQNWTEIIHVAGKITCVDALPDRTIAIGVHDVFCGLNSVLLLNARHVVIRRLDVEIGNSMFRNSMFVAVRRRQERGIAVDTFYIGHGLLWSPAPLEEAPAAPVADAPPRALTARCTTICDNRPTRMLFVAVCAAAFAIFFQS